MFVCSEPHKSTQVLLQNFINTLTIMRKAGGDIVYPCHLQTSISIKGRDEVKVFVSDEGAYPLSWLQFILSCLRKSASSDGCLAELSHSVGMG